jgi:AraC-like DNA-binding protein
MKEETLSDRVIKFIMTLDDEAFAVLTVTALAQEFNISRFKLLRTFKAEKRMTLECYLLQEKMSRCAFLLMSDRDITVKKVAEQMGFCTCDYFIQVFKKYFGLLPGQYKEYKTQRSGENRRSEEADRRKSPGEGVRESGDRRKEGRDRRKGPNDRRKSSSSLKKAAAKYAKKRKGKKKEKI